MGCVQFTPNKGGVFPNRNSGESVGFVLFGNKHGPQANFVECAFIFDIVISIIIYNIYIIYGWYYR